MLDGFSPIPLTGEQLLQEEEYAHPYHWEWAVKACQLDRIVRDFVSPQALRDRRVLDAGCGDGILSFQLADLGALVTGIDYSEKALRWARLLVPQAHFLQHDITEPFEAGHLFDYVFSREVLEHLPCARVPEALSSLRGVMHHDALMVLSVPANSTRDPKHFQHFTPSSLGEYLEPHFDADIRGYDAPPSSWVRIISRLFRNRLYTVHPVATVLRKIGSHVPLCRAGSLIALCRPK